jgi:hypothetical protein
MTDLNYDPRPAIDCAYEEVADFLVTEHGDIELALKGMRFSEAMMELGEADSWAAVWWSYGAVQTLAELGDLERGQALLCEVRRSSSARAAALMMVLDVADAAVKLGAPAFDTASEIALVDEALSLEPTWPSINLRRAELAGRVGDEPTKKRHADLALEHAGVSALRGEPFHELFTGRSESRKSIISSLRWSDIVP